MKSVLFVIPTLGGGGAEKVLVNLANHLDRTKYDIEILTLFRNDTNLKFLDKSIKVRSCLKKQFSGNRILFKLFSPKFLYKKFIGRRYDIVVSYLECPGERIVAGCPYADTKLVNWIHVEQHTLKAGAQNYRSINEFKNLISKFQRTITVSETVKNDYLGIINPGHPVDVIYNTLEVDAIKSMVSEGCALTFDKETLNVFSTGRLTEAKGYDRLINAQARLKSEGIEFNLYILGQGDLENTLKQQAEDLGISGNVRFLGFHTNPYKYLKNADLFVCSSRREGFSTAVSEALILGLPTVSTDCSGAKELLGENNEFGIVVENSEEGIYKGLKQVLTNTDTLQHYQEAAEVRGNKFSTSATVKAVEDMFDSL